MARDKLDYLKINELDHLGINSFFCLAVFIHQMQCMLSFYFTVCYMVKKKSEHVGFWKEPWTTSQEV
jgi:hypothetical protein